MVIIRDNGKKIEITAQASDAEVGRKVLRLMLAGGRGEDTDAPPDYLMGAERRYLGQGREGPERAPA